MRSIPLYRKFIHTTYIPRGLLTTYLAPFYWQTHPTVSGSVELGEFLSMFRCQVMYLSFGVVNFYGSTNLTEFTQTCIPGN